MTDGQHCPLNTQRSTFSRPWVREAGKNGVREGGLSWCSFTGFSLSRTADASCQWRSHGGSTLVRWASRDSLVGSRYLIGWCGDTRIGMVKAKIFRPKFQIIQAYRNTNRPEEALLERWARPPKYATSRHLHGIWKVRPFWKAKAALLKSPKAALGRNSGPARHFYAQ